MKITTKCPECGNQTVYNYDTERWVHVETVGCWLDIGVDEQ